MSDNKPNPIDWIMRNLGITRKQAETLMPTVGDKFPAAVIDPYGEDEPWVVREYKKDTKGWEVAP